MLERRPEPEPCRNQWEEGKQEGNKGEGEETFDEALEPLQKQEVCVCVCLCKCLQQAFASH